MLTPDYLLHVSEGAEAIAARLHTDVTKRITQRIIARQKRGDDYILTSADKWRIESLMDAGYLRDDLAADIAAATGKELQEIKEAFEDAGIRSAAYDDRIYKAAGLEPTPFKQSPYMQRVMQRNYDATAGLWQNYTATTADAAQQTFINAMDDIYMKVASGSMSYTEAYAEAIDDLARNGVDLGADSGNTYVAYKSGHRDTIEVATLRCVRTGVSQMTAQIGEARMDEMGVDLVIVSSHLGARPDHQVWQGKIYSRSGMDKKYPNFRESTHYGEGAGLCGWNCRHQFSPYFEGMDNPFTDYGKEENLEAYEQTQQQRAMERAIRKSRRATEVLRDSVNQAEEGEFKEKLKELSSRADKRLKRQLDAYSAYCDEHDLKPLPERLRIARASRATGRTNLDQVEVKRGSNTSETRERIISLIPLDDIEIAVPGARDGIKKVINGLSGKELEIFERSIKNARIFTQKDGTSNYMFGSRRITLCAEEQSAESMTNAFFHEYGHYIDDMQVNGIGYSEDFERSGIKFEKNTVTGTIRIRDRWSETARVSDLQNVLDMVAPGEYSAQDGLHSLTTGRYVGSEWGDDPADSTRLHDQVKKKLDSLLGRDKVDSFWRDKGRPQAPEWSDYMETYVTPKKRLVRTRERYKGAEQAYQEALQRYYEEHDKFMQAHEHEMDSFYDEYDRLSAEYRKKAERFGHVSDCIDAVAYGEFGLFASLGAHTPDYYKKSANLPLDEMWANYFMYRVQGDTEMLGLYKLLLPNTYGMLEEAFDKILLYL